jgi:hypothetical protein
MGLGRLDVDGYRRQLDAVRRQLAQTAEQAVIRGGGLAQFVWAESRGRSVEVYWDEQGICVFFWERDADSESHQTVLPSYAEAALVAQEWLAS